MPFSIFFIYICRSLKMGSLNFIEDMELEFGS